MPPIDNEPEELRNVEELVAFNKSLLKENRELRAENARLIQKLERGRKKTKGVDSK